MEYFPSESGECDTALLSRADRTKGTVNLTEGGKEGGQSGERRL